MSKSAISDDSMEKCLLDMPYEVLFEIFRTISKGKLIQISRLCSKFRHVAGDTRIWKDVYIKYKPLENFSFEELYSEPWPVKVIDLSHTKISPPVSLPTERMIKVGRLNLSLIRANEVTIAAILAKYQCTELHFDGYISGICPEAFSKQTDLDVLSVQSVPYGPERPVPIFLKEFHQFLASIFKYFKNLKTLDLRLVSFGNLDMPGFVKTLPTTLEKLLLPDFPKDPFFELLAERIPNLREIQASTYLEMRYQSLLNFKFLEAVHFFYCELHERLYRDRQPDHISDLYKYLIKFPALKTVHIIVDDSTPGEYPETFSEELRTMLQPHGIIVEITEDSISILSPYPEDGNLWEVLKST